MISGLCEREGKKKEKKEVKTETCLKLASLFSNIVSSETGREEQETCFALGTVKQWLYRLFFKIQTALSKYQEIRHKKSESGAEKISR